LVMYIDISPSEKQSKLAIMSYAASASAMTRGKIWIHGFVSSIRLLENSLHDASCAVHRSHGR
jgi:hypothetical protein